MAETRKKAGPSPHGGAPETADVLIVGGGMVGGTLAAALGGAGLSVALIDMADPAELVSAPYDGRASAIAYGSRRALEGIGLWPHMAAAAEPILEIRVSDGRSPLFLHYDHQEIGDEPLGHIIENRALRVGLYEHLAGLETVALHAPARLAGFDIEPGHVAARLEDGTEIRAALIVAADGKNSPLRKSMGIQTAEWSYPQTAIVCTMGHERPHEGVAHERFLPPGPFAVLPMTDDPKEGHRSSIVWTERTSAAPAFMGLDDDAFSAELGARFGDYLGDVRLIGGRWSYPLSLMHAQTYVLPRFALIGDAAHAIHPIAGQGLNLGLRDVAAFAEVVTDAFRLGLDIGGMDTLSKYQRWRRFDNMTLAAVTDGLNRLFSNDIGPVKLARDVGMAVIDRLPPAKRFFMQHAMGTFGKLPRLVKGERL